MKTIKCEDGYNIVYKDKIENIWIPTHVNVDKYIYLVYILYIRFIKENHLIV